MVVNTQPEPESAAVSFALMTNRDKGSQSPPIRPFQPYKLVTAGLDKSTKLVVITLSPGARVIVVGVGSIIG